MAAAGFERAEEIGRGGFDVVYRCRQISLDRTVAIKDLASDPDPENLERFLREQRAMGRGSGHPNIVHILQVGAAPTGRPYIVMEYHEHDSLEVRIRRSGPFAWGEALRLGVKVAGALETAHRLGTLHRDMKPANILLTDYGDPQLTDFGIARIAGGFEASTGGHRITGVHRPGGLQGAIPHAGVGRLPPRRDALLHDHRSCGVRTDRARCSKDGSCWLPTCRQRTAPRSPRPSWCRLPRPALDLGSSDSWVAGPRSPQILEAVQGKLNGGRWRPEWPPIPSTFLADALGDFALAPYVGGSLAARITRSRRKRAAARPP